MIYLGWILTNGRIDDKAEILPKIIPALCKALNLCASHGCGCLVEGNPIVCDEISHGSRFPIYRSEGPTWSIVVMAIRNTIRVDLYYDGPRLIYEYQDATNALGIFDHAVFVTHGDGVEKF